jgi:heterotetrameric sarcosine oxidase gamma subunit
VSEPVSLSPIPVPEPSAVVDGWLVSTVRSGADSTIADLTPVTKLLVRGTGPAVPFGRAAVQPDRSLVVGSAPGEWTVLGPPSVSQSLRTAVGADVKVVDITHGRALIRLGGVHTKELLAKVCSIDLSDEMCPTGAAFRAPLEGIGCDLVRWDRNGLPSFLVHCDRSFGLSLWEVLLDAGAEFGIGVGGFEPLMA